MRKRQGEKASAFQREPEGLDCSSEWEGTAVKDRYYSNCPFYETVSVLYNKGNLIEERRDDRDASRTSLHHPDNWHYGQREINCRPIARRTARQLRPYPGRFIPENDRQ
jgi:hypothetical protein